MAETKTQQIFYLPAEMVELILLNLPVKSLLRFSSVSKAWKSMISDSWFVKTYRGSERLFLFNWSDDSNPKTSSISISTSSSLLAQTQTFVFDVCPFDKDPCLAAVCNELWLASDAVYKSLFLWNPSMRTYKRLPYPSSIPGLSDDLSKFVYGLGYDSLTDDYKILKIQQPIPSSFSIELYSLRSDSWKDISTIDLNLDSSIQSVFVCGNLHWNTLRDKDVITSIISFDLSTEKFGEVALPNYSPSPSEEEGGMIMVGVLRGMLCLTNHYHPDVRTYDIDNCDVWLMEDYGVATSWTKKFTIEGFSTKKYTMPLYCYKNGDVLVESDNEDWDCEIIVYKDNKTTPRSIICAEVGYYYSHLYVDSLVSPWSTMTMSELRE